VVEELLHLHPLCHFHSHIVHQSTDMTNNGEPDLMTDMILFKKKWKHHLSKQYRVQGFWLFSLRKGD
jgi:hypothetical protein